MAQKTRKGQQNRHSSLGTEKKGTKLPHKKQTNKLIDIHFICYLFLH